MARLRGRIERAAALHREAAALAGSAASVLESYSPAGAPADQYAEQHHLAASLRAEAAALAPGWLSARLDALAPTTPLGGPLPPVFVRVGQAHPLDDARFPVIVPLLRAGHIAVDADARDNRVAGLLRSLLLRLLASSPPGSIRVRTIDAAEVGVFRGFTGIDTVMPPPVTDAEGLRLVLDEGERWIAERQDRGPTLLIVIASLPELTEGRDLARIAGLAHSGPAGRLHLIAAGWPPPPLTAETTQAPLPHATQIALRNPYAWVGDPPGASFAAGGVGPSRLNAPVYLDPDPPADVIQSVCTQLSASWATPPGSPGEPSRKAWIDYVSAGQRLDAVRREANRLVADHKAALGNARDDLEVLRDRLSRHQARLTALAQEAGRAADTTPTWQDAQAAQAMLAAPPMPAPGPPPTSPPPAMPYTSAMPVTAPPAGRQEPYGPHLHSGAYPIVTPNRPNGAPAGLAGSTTGWSMATTGVHTALPPPPMGVQLRTNPAPTSGAARPGNPAPNSVPARVSAALRASVKALDASEAALAEPGKEAGAGRLSMNFLVYAGFAVLAVIIQLPLLLMAAGDDGGRRIELVTIAGGVVLPPISFGLGWLTVGALSAKGTSRTPLLGAVVSLLALLPLLVLVALMTVIK